MSAKLLVHARSREGASLVEELLRPFRYVCHSSTSVETTIQLARRHGPIDVVICLDPDDAAKLRPGLCEISPDTRLLDLPAIGGDLTEAGNSYLETPGLLLDATELNHYIETALRGVRRPMEETVDVLRQALIETILTYSLLFEQFELINGGNSRLVMEYSTRVARELGLSSTHVNEIALAALLQDIGLLKLLGTCRARGLTELEPGRIRDHPIIGANLIEGMKLPWRIRHIVTAHHEWYNGLGYPRGASGRSIPLGARVLSVVNAFFSMISRRPNRAPLSKPEAIEELQRLAGRQFDPEVVEIFLLVMRDKAFHDPKHRLGRIAIVTSDRSFGELVLERFKDALYDTSLQGTGEGLLSRFEATPHDAVIIDASLDDMSGYQLLHWIKRDPKLATMATVIVANRDDGESYLAHDMGADDIIGKPARVADVLSRVKSVLRRRARLSRAAFTQMHDGEGLRGGLDELPARDLVRMLAEGRKTAIVTLLDGGSTGHLALDGGTLVHAQLGEQHGEEAFAELYSWRRGDFVIMHGAATPERNITRRTDLLLAEAEGNLDPAASSHASHQALAMVVSESPCDSAEAIPVPVLPRVDDTFPTTHSGSRTEDRTEVAIARTVETVEMDSDETHLLDSTPHPRAPPVQPRIHAQLQVRKSPHPNAARYTPVEWLSLDEPDNQVEVLDRASLGTAVRRAIADNASEATSELTAAGGDDCGETLVLAGASRACPLPKPERFSPTAEDGARTQLLAVPDEVKAEAPDPVGVG